MWSKPFERSMLEGEVGIVVNCPTKELHEELVQILTECGCRFRGGQPPSGDGRWDTYKEEFCFYIRNKSMLYGSKNSAFEGRNVNYIKCTFCGEMQDFETADDAEILKFLGT